MANTITSPNMSLPIPVTGVDAGPDYANNLNACQLLIDAHNHAPGNGVQINPSGLNINADLTFNTNNATVLRSVRLAPQVAVLAASTDLGCLYEVGVDLYYNDGAGNNVRITQSGGVAGSPGSISSLTSPASASYVSASSTFVWQSAANTPANLDAGSVILRNISASSFGITLSPPTLSSNYTITLPTLPVSTLPLSIGSSGTLSAAQITTAQIATGAVTTTQIASATITSGNIAAQAVTTTQIANSTIVGGNLATNINLPGKNVTASSLTVVTTNAVSGNGDTIIRGTIGSTGGIQSGGGYSVSKLGTGRYQVAFVTAFADVPVVTATALNTGINDPYVATIISLSSSVMVIGTYGVQGVSLQDQQFSFIVIGERS